jgi:hypothetical protein
MTWKETIFVEWPCWESGPFRIMRTEDGSYRLFRDKFIATDVWSGFGTLEEAKSKAGECLT